MSERLIDYLCGAADEVERAARDALLLHDAELVRELQVLRRAVAWLAEAGEAASPPAELAESTHRRIFPPPD
jgi:hypothetical protein